MLVEIEHGVLGGFGPKMLTSFKTRLWPRDTLLDKFIRFRNASDYMCRSAVTVFDTLRILHPPY